MAGSLPLSLSLSSRQMRLLTALGTGVLVGTSLVVIIPEGVATVYATSRTHSDVHAKRHVFGQSLPLNSLTPSDVPVAIMAPDARGPRGTVKRASMSSTDDEKPPIPVSGPSGATDHQDEQHASSPTAAEEQEYLEAKQNPRPWIGIALLTGFCLMYLVDTLPRRTFLPQHPQPLEISLNSFSLNASSHEVSDTSTTSALTLSHHESNPSSTTLGLVIHGIADGIALGASATAESSRLTMTIFLALILHKAPAAFGLTSILLSRNVSKRGVRAHLAVFSLASPSGALLSWASASSFASSPQKVPGGTDFATGLLLLFSGGTFLYVAVHAMQETQGAPLHDGGQNRPYRELPLNEYDACTFRTKEQPCLADAIICFLGMTLPLLLSVGLGHGHGHG